MVLAQRQVRDLLATEGYFRAKVTVWRDDGTGRPKDVASAPAVAASAQNASANRASAKHPVVVISIQPGPITVVKQAQVTFAGDIATTTNPDAVTQRTDISKNWSERVGSNHRFTQQTWRDAKTNALRSLVEHRYPRGRISFSQADIDAARANARLAVTLDSGPPFYLGPATVDGANRYPKDLAVRLSWLRPGQVYDQPKIIEAQQRLSASGYYDSSYISIDPDTAHPEAAPVHYSLTEAKRYKMQLGIGYRTDSGPRTSVEWRDNTFLGTTWRNDTALVVSAKEPLMQSGLTSLPNMDGWRWNMMGRAMQQDDGMLTTNSTMARVGRIQNTPQFDRSMFLQYDNAIVTGSGAASNVQVGDGAALAVFLGWTGRYFDSMLNPRRGYGLQGGLGLGITTKGQSNPFVRLAGRWVGILPVGSGGSRFAMRAEAGTLLASSNARVPSTYLWRTGGDLTVRGYSYRSIGVPLNQGVIAPGRYMASGSIEYQRPILQAYAPGLIEHVMFVDVGSVASRPADMRASVGVGTGLRLITPAGPMEIDVAYGLKVHQIRLHLLVGLNF
jgi:translocation and assembly module TamA